MKNEDRGHVEVYASSGQLAAAVAAHFADSATTATAERGGFYVALAGGTTPKAAYELLATEQYAETISWKDVFIYFGDERCVGPDDAESNYHMAKNAFLDAVNIPPENVHRMRGDADPHVAAQEYAQILKEDLGEFPRFDLILLGMGPDGHTASIFPGSPLVADSGPQLVAAPYVEKMKAHRITLTPRTINNAREVIISTEGSGKAPALAAVLDGPVNPEQYPVQIVKPTDGLLFWMVDEAAAAALND